jgi:hypothetical protein
MKVILVGMRCGGYVLASPVGMNDADNIHSIGRSAINAPMMRSAYNTTCEIRRRIRAESTRP